MKIPFIFIFSMLFALTFPLRSRDYSHSYFHIPCIFPWIPFNMSISMPRLQHKVNVDNAKTGKPSSNSIINEHTTVITHPMNRNYPMYIACFVQLPRPLCSFLAASATDTVMERRSRSRALAPAPAAPASVPGRPSMSTEHLREIVMFGWKIWRKSWKSKGNPDMLEWFLCWS